MFISIENLRANTRAFSEIALMNPIFKHHITDYQHIFGFRITMGAIASKITTSRLFNQAFIQTQIKENIKVPRHWPLCGEFTGDRWIPRTNDQLRGKCFRLMTSWWTVANVHLDRVCSESHLYIETIWIHLFYTHIADFFVRDILVLQKNPRELYSYLIGATEARQIPLQLPNTEVIS